MAATPPPDSITNTFNKGIKKVVKKAIKQKSTTSHTITLTSKHAELVSQLDSEQDRLPELQQELEQLKTKLNTLNSKSYTELTPDQILSVVDLRDKITNLETKINLIPQQKLKYFLRNGELLFNYAELEAGNLPDQVDQTDQSSASASTSTSTSTSRKHVKRLNVTEVFNKKKVVISTTSSHPRSKVEYTRQFLSNVDPNFVYIKENTITEDNFCEPCQQFRVQKQTEAKMVCPNCGEEISVIMDSDKPSLKDPPPETRHYEYKRFNHFCDWLSKIQGKESSEVPQDVINTVLLEIKRERITNLYDLDEETIRRYLRKHADKKYDKHYNHTAQILFKINGIQPLTLSPEREKDYKMMFLMIQEPYERHCPETRSNFSSYSYIIFKFAQLLDDEPVMKQMKLLKSKDKLNQLDVIWKKICRDLGGAEKGWKFLPSVKRPNVIELVHAESESGSESGSESDSD